VIGQGDDHGTKYVRENVSVGPQSLLKTAGMGSSIWRLLSVRAWYSVDQAWRKITACKYLREPTRLNKRVGESVVMVGSFQTLRDVANVRERPVRPYMILVNLQVVFNGRRPYEWVGVFSRKLVVFVWLLWQ
jgi:hypothetical protein